jgi:hypothetical protein
VPLEECGKGRLIPVLEKAFQQLAVRRLLEERAHEPGQMLQKCPRDMNGSLPKDHQSPHRDTAAVPSLPCMILERIGWKMAKPRA